jgi:hypothetical protein
MCLLTNKLVAPVIVHCLFVNTNAHAQTRTLTGEVVAETLTFITNFKQKTHIMFYFMRSSSNIGETVVKFHEVQVIELQLEL